MKNKMESRCKSRNIQPSLKFFLSKFFQLFLHAILSISTRLTPLLISIASLSLLLIAFNSPTPSVYPTFHRSPGEPIYSSFSRESVDKSNAWSFLSSLLLKLTATLTTGTTGTTNRNTTGSHQFKPSRFSEPTSSQATISSACAERWISSGSRCPSLNKPNPPQAIDLVWTWVNNSVTTNPQLEPLDPESTRISNSAYLYRQNDELKYSLRSSLESLPSKYINSRIILTADKLTSQGPDRNQEDWTSRPNWLSTEDSQPHHRVLLKHHSDIFKFKAPSPLSLNQSDWFQNHVPSHNSLAIESQFGNIPGIKNDFVYLNDDLFLINKFREGDFTSGLFGPVFRIQFDLNVTSGTTDWSDPKESIGEWPSLDYSNYLLNMRFGSRPRRYIVHVVKVSNIQMMREVSEIWEDEIFLTASSKFRGQRREINMLFLTTWYQIEKQREAMLHSFLMLKSDSNQDGTISDYEWEEMMNEVTEKRTEMKDAVEKQSNEVGPTIIRVFKPFRPQSEPIEELLGDYAPSQTNYEWLSSNGYPLINQPESIPNYQTKEDDESRTVICELNVTRCFPNDYRRSEDLMRWISIENPECGDCLISLLVGKNPMGMEAFLPPAGFRTKIAKLLDQPVYRNSFSSSHKHFNQTRYYSDRRHTSSRLSSGNFLTDDPRIWAIRNLQRYQYVLGNTQTEFHTLTTIYATRKILNGLTSQFRKKKKIKAQIENKKLSGENRKPREENTMKPQEEDKKTQEENRNRIQHDGSLVAINDHINNFQYPLVKHLFKKWLQSSWPRPAPWEKK